MSRSGQPLHGAGSRRAALPVADGDGPGHDRSFAIDRERVRDLELRIGAIQRRTRAEAATLMGSGLLLVAVTTLVGSMTAGTR